MKETLTENPAGAPLNRAAVVIEVVLQFLTGAAIVAVLVMMANLDRLLAPDESEILVRARLFRTIAGLAMPLIILFLLSGLRHRLIKLLTKQGADREALNSVKYIWLTVIGFVGLILAIDVNIFVESLSDISFK